MAKPRTIATYGPYGRTVRVFSHKGMVRVRWTLEDGTRKTKSFRPDNRQTRVAAKAFARQLSDKQASGEARSALTVGQLWERYKATEFRTLRPSTRKLYAWRWNKFALFAGDNKQAAEVEVFDLDRLRNSLDDAGVAVNQQRELFKVVKLVYRWAEGREMLERNRTKFYRFKVAKEDRVQPPAPYTVDEYEKLRAALDPAQTAQWRPWAVMTLLANQGVRLNAVLHLRWEDFDLNAGAVTWQGRWDKTGKTWRQPLRVESLEAIAVATLWAANDGYEGPWVFYSAHRKKRLQSGDAATYGKTSFLAMLTKAEERAGVEHKPYRGAHGFRRMVASEVARATGNPMDGMHWIGDADLSLSARYLQSSLDTLREAAEAADRRKAI